MKDHPDGAREVRLPGLRENQPTAGTLQVVPRQWAGPSFLAMLLFEQYGEHRFLYRQTERFAREGVALSMSTLEAR